MVNILVVDDEEIIRKGLLEALCSKHHIDLAVDGLEALQKIGSNDGYEKIITDFYMPRMNGFELMEELREKRDYKGEIYVISSSEVSKDVIDIFDAKFYRKPDGVERLVNELNSM